MWDRSDYLAEGRKQLEDKNSYEETDFSEKDLSNFVWKSNDLFRELYSRKHITERQLKYFSYGFNSSNLGKTYLLPKIHKQLYSVPGRAVISDCGTPTEKVSEFVDHILKPVMRFGNSYIKANNHFLEKLKELGELPENAILVTADVVGLYPSISHGDGSKALR